jgi:hypothetical protein
MGMPRFDHVGVIVDDPGARDLLESATPLRLGYNGSDGFPRVIRSGFYWDGNQIVIFTATTAPKVAALSHAAISPEAGERRSGCTRAARCA